MFEENFANMISFPLDHPLYAGKLPNLANQFRSQTGDTDLLFLAGTEAFMFSYPPTVRPVPESAKLIHLDQITWEIGKNFSIDVSLYGNPKLTLPLLLDTIESSRTEEEFKRYEARKKLVAKEILDDMHKSTPSPKKNSMGTRKEYLSLISLCYRRGYS